MDTYILGIESSCDDTSAAVLKNNNILANIIANQAVHNYYGGVVPELASRAHQQNIIPVVHRALEVAKIKKNQLHGIAFTNGPGLLGSLLVGVSFAKAFSLALDIPLIEINHMQAHVLAHFIEDEQQPQKPVFPFLCLTVSGGHTQIMLVRDYFDMQPLGQTIDDAAGEAFDKAAKIMGLPFPGGPLIDKLAQEGNPHAIKFPHPNIPGLDFSFSGLKTSILYFIRDRLKEDPNYIENNKPDICASVQYTIIEILLHKLRKAVKETGINQVAIAGGVSANSGLRQALLDERDKSGWKVFIPRFEFTTDNAAMVAIAGYYKYLKGDFASLDTVPFTRFGSSNG
jgi:N6-L-threonylcarbamoyladenine synthase